MSGDDKIYKEFTVIEAPVKLSRGIPDPYYEKFIEKHNEFDRIETRDWMGIFNLIAAVAGSEDRNDIFKPQFFEKFEEELGDLLNKFRFAQGLIHAIGKQNYNVLTMETNNYGTPESFSPDVDYKKLTELMDIEITIRKQKIAAFDLMVLILKKFSNELRIKQKI